MGFLEKDPIRGDDSFRTFEEVLALAKSNRVDMVLLGGDLFHENKPSRKALVRTMKILRDYCLGEDPVSVAVRSDPDQVNYMHPSYAVSLPVFVIHGNHDDPTGAVGADALSALDILAQANLVTYFGKTADSRRISIMPILLQKGITKLALYGLGNVRDDVLYETWSSAKQVQWLCPREGSAQDDNNDDIKWFNVFLIHQNRVTRGTARAIADSMLPQWLDYVVWGHEHDSIPEISHTMPPVIQPGSTVATSLSEGESLPKHVVLLEVYKGAFKHRPIPLQTVRNFEFDDIRLGDPKLNLSVVDVEGIEKLLCTKFEQMISRQEAVYDLKRSLFESGEGLPPRSGVSYPSKEFYLAHLPRELRAPLIRLRVDTSGGYESLKPLRFVQSYDGRVACPKEMLLFYKKRATSLAKSFLRGHIGKGIGRENLDSTAGGEIGCTGDLTILGGDGKDASVEGDNDNGVGIPTLVEYFLYHKDGGASGLKFLELDQLSSAVDDFVAKAENRAIPDYVLAYLENQVSTTVERQERKGSVLTAEELKVGFQSRAEAAANRVFEERAKGQQRKLRDDDTKNATLDAEDGPDGAHEDKDIDSSAVFANLHAMLSRNSTLAAISRAAQETTAVNNVSDDDFNVASDEEVDDQGTALTHKAPRNVRRGRGRKQSASGVSSRTKSRASVSSTRARGSQAVRAGAMLAVGAAVRADEHSDDNIGGIVDADESAVGVPDSEEESEDAPRPKRRKASSSSRDGTRRASSRARVAHDGAGSRFSARGRLRNLTATIDLDDDSD